MSQHFERRYDLDWLRVIAFGLLIFYHVGMFFVPWGWHIKNIEIYEWLVFPMLFLNQWRLPLLFLISGMGTYYALQHRTGWEFTKERLLRLLLPLAFGMLLVVPPQVYIERLDKGQFIGAYWEYWPLHAFEGGAYPQGNISWHHLWFIVYLLLLSLCLLPLLLYLRKRTESWLLHLVKHWVSSPLRVYLLCIPLYLLESLVEPFFPPTNGLINDWFNLINSGTLFLYGFLLVCVEKSFWPMALAHKHQFLRTGLISFVALLFIKFNFEDGMLVHFIEAVIKTVNLWSWLLTILGYGATWFNRPSPVLAYSNRAVYPFYILHQSVTIVLAYYLKPFDMPFLFKFGLLCLGTFVVCWGLYVLLTKARLGVFFGGSSLL